LSFDSWLIFVSVAFIATVTPGPAILLVTTHSVSYGLNKSIFTIFGNISGLLLMSTLSVAGLSTILLYSTTAFIFIKFAGAIYLIYLGVKLWRFGFLGGKSKNQNRLKEKSATALSLYMQGILVSLSNPKALAFTTALFPQFIDASLPLSTQFTILITTFMLLSFSCLFTYGFATTKMSKTKVTERTSNIFSKVFGSAFIASGLALAGTTR